MTLIRKDSGTEIIGHTTFAYDPHGRGWKIMEARSGTTTYAYTVANGVAPGDQENCRR